MPGPDVVSIRDLEDAGRSVDRVGALIDAIAPDNLSALNVDMLQSVSLVLGVSGGILFYRERIAKLPEFEIRNVDNIVDYAKSVWFLRVTTFDTPAEVSAMEAEVFPLRSKLMVWATPLEASGIFNTAAMNKIREGSGPRDGCGDLVALAALYRSHWDQVRTMCGVTEQDINRAAVIGPAVYAALSRRENAPSVVPEEGELRVRKAWTLLDRAYDQCRRAIQYLRYNEGDADVIAPSLRRNLGRRTASTEPAAPAQPTPAATPTEPSIGGTDGPFVKNG